MPYRSLFVLILMAIGVYYSMQAPFYALLVYLANAYLRPEQWLWINVVPSSFSFVFGTYVLLKSIYARRPLILHNRLIPMYAFLLHSFLSVFFSDYFTSGWVPWVSFFKAFIITYCIVVLVTDFFQFRLVLLILVLFLGVEGAKQGWVYLIEPPAWGSNENSVPFLGDNNGVAVGMLMLVPLVALLGKTMQRRWIRYGFWFLLIGIVFRALSTYSRGGFLACIALGGVYWLRSRQKLRVLLSIAAIVAIVYPSLSEKYWARMDTISTNSTGEGETDDSAQGRLHFWKVAIVMANTHPLLGVGSNCFNRAYSAYDFSGGRYGRIRAVHSSYFGVLGELGYIGLIIYVTILFSAMRSCHRVRKLVARHPTLLPLSQSATALETSLVVFLVGGAFLSFQYEEMLWHFIGFTIVLEELAIRSVFASESTEGALPDVAVIGATV